MKSNDLISQLILIGPWLLIEALGFQRIPSTNVIKAKTKTIQAIDSKG